MSAVILYGLLALMLLPFVYVGLRGRACWRRFAARYATDRPAEGLALSARTVDFLHVPRGEERPDGERYWIGFSGFVAARAASDGLDLRLPKTMGLPRPLRLPWSHLRDVDLRDDQAWCVFEHPEAGRFEVGLPPTALPVLEEALHGSPRPNPPIPS
jgi:hypothetical protein